MASRLRATCFATLLLACNSASATGLMDVYRSALQNDPVFLAAEYQQQAAIEAVPQARAALLPQVSASANVNRTEVNDDRQGAYNGDLINLSLSQTIYRHSNYVNLSRARLQVEQANIEYDAARQSLLFRSAERYFAILAAEDNLEFARSEKNAIQRQLEQAERRFEVGLIAITDVREAQARFDLAAAQEIDAQNQLEAAKEAMRVLTGARPNRLRTLDEASKMVAPTPENVVTWVNSARANNLDLRVAKIAVELSKKSIALERAARLPNTELIADYSDIGRDGAFTTDTETSQIRLQVTVPLYTGGLIGSRVRQASANYELARQQLDSQRRTTEQQTRDAYRNVLSGISRANALKQALISTQSGAEATEAGFDVGTRTAVEVLTALRETYRAQADYSSARYNYILDTLRLKQATGTLSVEDLTQVDSWLLP